MKLATVRIGNESIVAVGIDDDRVISIERLLDLAGLTQVRAPTSMLELIAAGSERLGTIDGVLGYLDRSVLEREARVPDAWYPPIRRPSKILAVAMNNSASNERKISAPDHPAFFLKPSSCLIGHGEAIRIRPYYGSVHPEPELALVIGATAKDLTPEDALDYVFGFTIFNDITSNGMRAEDRFHYWAVYADPNDPEKTQRVEQHLSYAARYKGTDTFGVLGPWIVTRNEVADPDNLNVQCTVGNDTVADDSTSYYNFRIAEVLSFISQFQTLNRGDVVSLGTAFKPGSGRKSIHHANFQTVDGPVSVSIEGLGRQQNPVVRENRELSRWRLK